MIGASGSGKSVLLKCILGLIEPDAGVIEIDGRDVLKLGRSAREAVRAQIGMLFQNGALSTALPFGKTSPSDCWRATRFRAVRPT